MKSSLIFLLLLAPCFAVAETQAILIGGGYKLESSQGQIEENVRWLQKTLPVHVKSLDIFFGSGADGKTHDVVYWDHSARNSGQRNPLADVFDSPASEWIRYKHNQINPSMGSSEKSNLLSKLEDYLPAIQSNNFLLVYNGHGGYGGLNKTHMNNLLLWNNTELNVGEFRKLLDKVPSKTTSRFVLTQCYSGGFYDAVITNGKVTANRCGFMADAENLEAEGCELGINKDDFRDYTTYFFAALNGKSRYGEPLAFNPDKDENQKISFQEAHFYALETALSSDLSRSTTEIFLERWQPWYLRWQNFSDSIQNNYAYLAKAVSSHHSIPWDKLTEQRTEKETELKLIEANINSTTETIKSLQKNLIDKLILEFPFLFHPFTRTYITSINHQEAVLNQRIQELSDYSLLVEQLTLMEKLFIQELSIKRDITQIEKVRRLQRLAVLEDAFYRVANDPEKAEYQSLLNCEKGYLD